MENTYDPRRRPRRHPGERPIPLPAGTHRGGRVCTHARWWLTAAPEKQARVPSRGGASTSLCRARSVRHESVRAGKAGSRGSPRQGIPPICCRRRARRGVGAADASRLVLRLHASGGSALKPLLERLAALLERGFQPEPFPGQGSPWRPRRHQGHQSGTVRRQSTPPTSAQPRNEPRFREAG